MVLLKGSQGGLFVVESHVPELLQLIPVAIRRLLLRLLLWHTSHGLHHASEIEWWSTAPTTNCTSLHILQQASKIHHRGLLLRSSRRRRRRRWLPQ